LIDSFRGEYRFLSNFWPVEVVFDDVVYASVEHGYQAAKTLSPMHRAYVRQAETPGEAKRRGRKVAMRQDWEQVKLVVMLDLVRQKFKDPVLREMLLATGNEHLAEGNNWQDRFWGTVDGVGKNHLGRILMQVREEVR
jgi:ribA/ribD-fused uncharacterized protein